MDNPEETTYQDEADLQTEPRRRWPLFVGGLALVIVLGAAAFLAGRLMNRPGQSGNGPGGPNQMRLSVKGGPGGGEKSFELNIKPAPELPTTPPETDGIFVERKDNSLFVGTGNIGIKVAGGPGVQATAETSYDGPVIEVVVTQDTKIYHDVTELDMEDPGAEVQQVVELGSIEEIGPNSSISAWGKKVGDRIIADVIFYNQPYLMKALGGK